MFLPFDMLAKMLKDSLATNLHLDKSEIVRRFHENHFPRPLTPTSVQRPGEVGNVNIIFILNISSIPNISFILNISFIVNTNLDFSLCDQKYFCHLANLEKPLSSVAQL